MGLLERAFMVMARSWRGMFFMKFPTMISMGFRMTGKNMISHVAQAHDGAVRILFQHGFRGRNILKG